MLIFLYGAIFIRSGSENYEINGPDERLSSSDHSDKYSHIYMYGNENGDIMSSKNRVLHGGEYLRLSFLLLRLFG